MKKEKNTWLPLCIGLLLAILLSGNVLAAGTAIPCIMTAEDVGNGYEYTVAGIGKFSVNGLEGETLSAAAFTAERDCAMVFYKDGSLAEVDGGMVLDPGAYEMRLYRASDTEQKGDYGSFLFAIDNDYAATLERMDPENLVVVENPALELTVEEPSLLQGQQGGRRFRYMLPSGESFVMNVPQGGWSRGEVKLETSPGLNVYMVRLDGEPLDFSDGMTFNQTGSYEILVRDNELGTSGNVSYSVTICFTLYVSKTMNISHINAPMGLRLAAAYRDGVEASSQEGIIGSDFIHLEADGSWVLEFADPAGNVVWDMELERDATAPYLRFSQETDGKTLAEAVSFTPSEVDAQIHIYRNGERAVASKNQIAVNGVYHIEVMDGAGNVRDYDFSVGIRHTLKDKKLVIIPVVLLLAAGAVLLYWRKNIQVL